jgi:hypothetical protein
MAKVTSYRSEQRLDDGYELLPVLAGVSQQSGTDQDVVRAKLPELLSQDWDFGDSQVERPRCPGQGPFHGSDKFCLEQRADAALHGRAMLLMAVVAPPDGVEEVSSDDHLEFRRRIKGLEGGWGPPRAEVGRPVRVVRLTLLPQCLVPPVVPLQSRLIWSLIAGARDSRRSRRQPAIAGRHLGNVADEQADHQGLGLIGTDQPACLIHFMHCSHLSLRENCMIVAWAQRTQGESAAVMTCRHDGCMTDWQRWHTPYDDPTSALSARCQRGCPWSRSSSHRLWAAAPFGPLRLLSLCSGQGRDVLPVLASIRGVVTSLAALSS